MYEEWFALSLIVRDGECGGAVLLDIRTGESHVVRAKAVIIATGGLGRVFEPSTNALICTGDGMALAYRAGAPLMDMEMVQYHPTTLAGSGVLITEGARGEGAHLLNSEGERFMERYAPNMMELASRDVVSRSEQTEINEGRGVNGGVLLDCRHPGRADHQGEAVADTGDSQGLRGRGHLHRADTHQARHALPDGRREDGYRRPDPAPRPLFGRRGSLRQRTRRQQAGGQFAPRHPRLRTPLRSARLRQGKGDTAYRRRRLGGRRRPGRPYGTCWRGTGGGDTFASIRKELGETMNRRLAVFRDQAGMEEALATLSDLKDRFSRVTVADKGKTFNTNLVFTLELGFMLDCAETIIMGALKRKESRGAHTRTDMPARDDAAWLKHIVLTQGPETPSVEYQPITITQWEPQVRSY